MSERLFTNVNHCLWCKADLFSPKPRLVVTKDWAIGGVESFTYIECGSCKSWALQNRPTDDQIRLYYPQDYGPYTYQSQEIPRLHLSWPAVAPRHVHRAANLLSACQGNRPTEDMRVLDYGFGNGFWLARAAETFPGCQLTGVDFDREGARRRIAWMKQSVQILEPAEFDDLTNSYQMMYFGHSLEHLKDPTHTLSVAVDQLSSQGILQIALPIADSTSFRWFGPHWFVLEAPRHFSIPSLQAVRRAVQEAGAMIVFENFYGSPSVALRSLAYARNNHEPALPGVSEVLESLSRKKAVMHALIQSRLIKPSKFILVAVKPG